MSGYLMGRAFYAELAAPLKFLLVACCDHANDDGLGVWAGQEVLAGKVGTSSRSVRDHLKELIRLGYLEREPERHPRYGTHQHRVIVDALPSTAEIREIKIRWTNGRPELAPATGKSRRYPPEDPSGSSAEPASGGESLQVSAASHGDRATPPEDSSGARPEDDGLSTGSQVSGYTSVLDPSGFALASASAEGKSATKTPNQILAEILLDSSSSAQHFLRRLVEVDERWGEITPAALMKLGKRYGAGVVVEALGYMREESRGGIDPYPYLESVCVRVEAERQAVPA